MGAGKGLSLIHIFSAIGDFFKNLFTLKGLLKLVIVIIVIEIIILIIKFINGRKMCIRDRLCPVGCIRMQTQGIWRR